MAKFIGNGGNGQAVNVQTTKGEGSALWTAPRSSGGFLADFLMGQQVSPEFLDTLAAKLTARCRAWGGRGWFGTDAFTGRDCSDCGGYGNITEGMI